MIFIDEFQTYVGVRSIKDVLTGGGDRLANNFRLKQYFIYKLVCLLKKSCSFFSSITCADTTDEYSLS